ncbi:translation elongation factor Ts [Fodinicurvata sp. EGI_FJ10296]|uniref:translation elongation factor Ts n=1 Tax=Fodinicurvata sp. EGI_FJ10296 TaxID=3231908 RepID=UPI0034546FDC
MAQISAALVKDLREKTGAGMMDCKKALNETDGDIDSAVDWLRKKGLSQAAKKSGRTAAEGLVGVAVDGPRGAVVEVNAETDFVARNDKFQDFVSNVAKLSMTSQGDIEALKTADYPGTGRNVADELTNLIATIGENMQLRRSAVLAVENGVVAPYVHSATAEGLGRIGVLVAVESTGPADKLMELGRSIAMHVAAARPDALSRDDVDAEAVERERNVLIDQAKASGKTQEIAEKMVVGRMRKYYEEVVLLEQVYVIDGERTVGKAVEDMAAELGVPVAITGFVRFNLGEGVDTGEKSDFASEVAATLGG